jgi:hypothetical protein
LASASASKRTGARGEADCDMGEPLLVDLSLFSVPMAEIPATAGFVRNFPRPRTQS